MAGPVSLFAEVAIFQIVPCRGLGTDAVSALVTRLAATQRIRQVTAVTGADNAASRRLLERRGFRLTGQLPGTDEVRYTLDLR